MTELSAAEREHVAALVAELRAAQGLPPTITDPMVLDRVAALVRPHLSGRPASSELGPSAA